MESDSSLFVIGAVVIVLLMTIRGWRLGIVRQALSIVSLGAAYIAGLLFGEYLIPVLRPLGYPDRILTIIGSALIVLTVYFSLGLITAVLFKRTNQQSVGLVKFGFGAAGALLGAVFGLFVVFVCAIAVRVAGSLAEAELRPNSTAVPTSPLAARLAGVKRSIEQSPAGPIIEKIDPVPTEVYDTLGKISRLVANPTSMEKMASEPDVRRLSAHPRILALRDDPEVQLALRNGEIFSLLRHPKLVEAANDPELMRQLAAFDLQKALDRAVPPPQKTPAR